MAALSLNNQLRMILVSHWVSHSSYGFSRGLTSRHTRDLRIIFGVVLLTISFGIFIEMLLDGAISIDEDKFQINPN